MSALMPDGNTAAERIHNTADDAWQSVDREVTERLQERVAKDYDLLEPYLENDTADIVRQAFCMTDYSHTSEQYQDNYNALERTKTRAIESYVRDNFDAELAAYMEELAEEE